MSVVLSVQHFIQTIEVEVADWTHSDTATLLKNAPAIIEAMIANNGAKPGIEVINDVAPEVTKVLEKAANFMFPGSGTALDMYVNVFYGHTEVGPHEMTPSEEDEWFRRVNPPV
jgi:hypothetical protein